MSYHLPTDKELIEYVSKTNSSFLEPDLDDYFTILKEDITTAMSIAKLNINQNREYYRYLKYLRRYVSVCELNRNSTLRIKVANYFKLRELHQIL